MRLNLKAKYSLAIVLLVIFIVTLLAGIILFQSKATLNDVSRASSDTMKRNLSEEMEKRGELLARILAVVLIKPVYQYDMETIYDITNATKEQKDVVYVYVYGPEGKIIHDGTKEIQLLDKVLDDEVSKKAVSAKGLLVQTTEDVIDVAIPIKVYDVLLGGVRVGFSTEEIRGDIEKMGSQLGSIGQAGIQHNIWTIVVVAAGLSLLGILLAILVAGKLTDPIATLSSLAYRIGRGEYDIDISLKQDDEIGDLSRSFKKMADNLHKTTTSRDKLDAVNRQLQENQEELRKNAQELKSRIEDANNARLEAEALKVQAEAASLLKSRFLANMSHEIRTPMNAVLGFANLLKKTELDDSQKHYLKVITTSGDALLVLINDILDLSKIEAGSLVLEQIDFNLEYLIENAVKMIKPKCQENDIDLLFEFSPDITPNYKGDPTRIRQIVLNLLSNAVKFTKKGEIGVTVKASGTQPEDGRFRGIEISVKDTGIGIDEDKQNNIFGAFSQADETTTRKYGGTGLGLAIARALAEKMDGDIQVRSKVGQGSEFIVTLQLETRETKTEREEGAITQNADEKISLKGVKVLVVEDVAENQELIKIFLDTFGCVTDLADNGREAVEKIKNNSYDVCLMDIQMPVMGGIEAAEVIRREVDKDIPIIAITGAAMKEDRDRALQSGMNDYLTKPIDMNKLKETIGKWKKV